MYVPPSYGAAPFGYLPAVAAPYGAPPTGPPPPGLPPPGPYSYGLPGVPPPPGYGYGPQAPLPATGHAPAAVHGQAPPPPPPGLPPGAPGPPPAAAQRPASAPQKQEAKGGGKDRRSRRGGRQDKEQKRTGSTAPPKSSPSSEGIIKVEGCVDEVVCKIVRGKFLPHSENHGKTVWKRTEQVNKLDVLIYFWDQRDGPELYGWWFAPKIGGDAVWAYNPTRPGDKLPPTSGWKVPYDADEIDKTIVITHISSQEVATGTGAGAAEAPGSGVKRPPASGAAEIPGSGVKRPPTGPQVVNPPDKKQAKKTDEDQKKKDNDAKLKVLLEELAVLVEQAEKTCASLKESVEHLERLDTTQNLDEAAVVCSKIDEHHAEGKEVHKKCSDKILGNSLPLDQASKQVLMSLLGRLTDVNRSANVMVNKTKITKDKVKEERERLARKAAALRQEEKKKNLFAKYDKDGDGMLRTQEVQEFVQEEYKCELPGEALDAIMKALTPEGGAGVPSESFARLRTLVGIAREEVKNKQRRLEREEKEAKEREEILRLKALCEEKEKRIRTGLAELSAALEGGAELVASAEAKAKAPESGGAAVVPEQVASAVDDARSLLGPLRGRLEALLSGSSEEPKVSAELLAEAREVQERLGALHDRLEKLSAKPA